MPESKSTLESANVGPGKYNIAQASGKQSSNTLFPYNGSSEERFNVRDAKNPGPG